MENIGKHPGVVVLYQHGTCSYILVGMLWENILGKHPGVVVRLYHGTCSSILVGVAMGKHR
jgi:uncharacterized membrane protein